MSTERPSRNAENGLSMMEPETISTACDCAKAAPDRTRSAAARRMRHVSTLLIVPPPRADYLAYTLAGDPVFASASSLSSNSKPLVRGLWLR
jgi:hypothetical protein